MLLGMPLSASSAMIFTQYPYTVPLIREGLFLKSTDKHSRGQKFRFEGGAPNIKILNFFEIKLKYKIEVEWGGMAP